MLEQIARGLLGIFVLLFICFLISNNKRKINWRLVVSGMLLQLFFALVILKVPAIKMVFSGIGAGFNAISSFTDAGVDFLTRSFVTGEVEPGVISFLFRILPTIVFFSALTSILYYLGILQKIVYAFAWLMSKTMKLSGAETLSGAANIFLGQTEAPLMVRPFIPQMTRSEILCLMVGGMSNIAGGVFIAYMTFLGGTDPEQRILFATHLLTASIMSMPAAFVVAKMMIPETEPIDQELKLNKDKLGTNLLEAISIGTEDGLKLAVNVGAMLLVFTALIAMANAILFDVIGAYTGANAWIQSHSDGLYQGLTMQYILGNLLAPVSWLLGIAKQDIVLVGQLLGEKTILNEFIAYKSLGEMKEQDEFYSDRSILIATYALCGFANFASIGIQIGGIGNMAANKKSQLAQLGIKALIGGTIASFLTAVMAGMLL
jgi:concentrative nucleoside transporter, CNT family